MFSSNSRYANAGTYTITRADGTVVTVTRLPLPEPPDAIGSHQRQDGQRLDLIASRYLADATQFWRLCDANDALSAEALGEHEEVDIPPGGRNR